MQTVSAHGGAPWSPFIRGLVAVLPVALVAVSASWITRPAIPAWYSGLAKPPLTPPNAAFGPAWTILYVLIAAAIYLVLSTPPGRPGRRTAIAAYALQLGLNGLWSLVFFGTRDPALGLVVVVALFCAIIGTIAAFQQIDGTAAFLLLPYLGWIAFAAYLNAGVWLLN